MQDTSSYMWFGAIAMILAVFGVGIYLNQPFQPAYDKCMEMSAADVDPGCQFAKLTDEKMRQLIELGKATDQEWSHDPYKVGQLVYAHVVNSARQQGVTVDKVR